MSSTNSVDVEEQENFF